MINLLKGDCLELLSSIEDNSIDAVIVDPPYGTTSCKWDSIIPLEPMWSHLERIVKPNRAIVIFGQEPYSSILRASNLKKYKYDWVWEKTKIGGFMNAKNAPLKQYENIMVFSDGTIANGSPRRMLYNPQGLVEINATKKNAKRNTEHTIGERKSRKAGKSYTQQYTNYPKNILQFNSVLKPDHPTEKPCDLLEYLVLTYTNEKDTVLDFCMGVGSCGLACKNTNRSFIGMELNEEYFNIASNRLL